MLGSRPPGAGKLGTFPPKEGRDRRGVGKDRHHSQIGTILTHSIVFLSFQGEPAPGAGHQGHRGAAALQRDHGQQHEEKRQTQPGPEVREDTGASSRTSREFHGSARPWAGQRGWSGMWESGLDCGHQKGVPLREGLGTPSTRRGGAPSPPLLQRGRRSGSSQHGTCP